MEIICVEKKRKERIILEYLDFFYLTEREIKDYACAWMLFNLILIYNSGRLHIF